MKKQFTFSDFKSQITIEQYLLGCSFPKKLLSYLKLHNEDIQVNGHSQPTTYSLNQSDVLQIAVALEENPDILATPMNLDIVYEDSFLILINKPSSLPVHPSKGNFTGSLANGLKYYYQSTGQNCSYHCITRIDTDTTGLVLIGKDPLTAALLNKEAASHKIKKKYLALVQGKTEESGMIDAPISKSKDGIRRIVDFKDGQTAKTFYRSIGYSKKENCSLCEITLATGRTHQIRVHFQSIGHPLIGDKLYNPDNHQLARTGLHVSEICFLHPFNKQEILLKCKLPDDMRMIGEPILERTLLND